MADIDQLPEPPPDDQDLQTSRPAPRSRAHRDGDYIEGVNTVDGVVEEGGPGTVLIVQTFVLEANVQVPEGMDIHSPEFEEWCGAKADEISEAAKAKDFEWADTTTFDNAAAEGEDAMIFSI